MRTSSIVVTDPSPKNSPDMFLIKRNYEIQKFSTCASNHPFMPVTYEIAVPAKKSGRQQRREQQPSPRRRFHILDTAGPLRPRVNLRGPPGSPSRTTGSPGHKLACSHPSPRRAPAFLRKRSPKGESAAAQIEVFLSSCPADFRCTKGTPSKITSRTAMRSPNNNDFT
jgi:hypothetical protein